MIKNIKHKLPFNPTFGLHSFRPLAGYIFGGNQSRTGSGNQTVAMTAPVLFEEKKSSNIAMTAPVLMNQSENAAGGGDAGGGNVRMAMSFVMPSQFARIEDLPLPNDARVILEEKAPETVAVTQFSGYLSSEIVAEKERSLREACAQDGIPLLSGSDSIVAAAYNPPWTPGFLRRNEVMIKVDPVHAYPEPAKELL